MAEPRMKMYWVITVKDPGDREAGVCRYERRFEFGDPKEALECAQGAKKAGFDVSAAKVLATREKVSSSTVPG
jgi:hypothetical protein